MGNVVISEFHKRMKKRSCVSLFVTDIVICEIMKLVIF